jgi:UMF1 family MFS transporter
LPHHGEGGALGRTGFAWAIFEWARNPYYILIVIYIFAPYFARDIVGADILASGELDGLDPETATQTANARGQAAIASVTKWAGLIAALTAPFLGAALDRGGRRKPILAIMLGTIAVMSWLLWYAIPGEEGLPTTVVMVVLVIAYVCYTYSEVTHNSMLPAAGRPEALPMISGMGLGLGNLAATLMFMALVGLFALPAAIGWPFAEPQFGFDLERYEHMRIAGPLCAIWLVVFAIPFFTHARDPGVPGASWSMAAIDGAKSVVRTMRKAAQYAQLMKFLLARMFYADAMAALLALGAVYVSLFLEWGFLEMTGYAIFASAWAFLGGLVGGWLDNKVGVKLALIIEILGMVAVLALQLSITNETLFFGTVENYQVWEGLVFQDLSDLVYLGLAAVLAVTATASISSSRTMLVALAPPGRAGEFFGLYAIAGTVTVWLGPLLVEIFTTAFNSQRIGMASIAILFAIGLVFLTWVRVEQPEA